MAKRIKTLHLICNAHLDPVWLWHWQEGAGEALSTFRTAADICEADENFIFNHNEVILYEWVRQYEPELFRRIRRLVKAGRWHIMGGWYVQPDCNIPSGESFVRQILLGRAYFKKHFGVMPATAINFDPFGHTRGLVQILAKSGYDSYLFGRPQPNDLTLPAETFLWLGYDGSQIMTHRFRFPYLSRLGAAGRKLRQWLDENPDTQLDILLWGVGNHGGGPSRRDLCDVNVIVAKTKSHRIRHSTPEAYFRQAARAKAAMPKHCGDLNPWAIGCYTSQIRIKQKHRRLENEIYSLEKMASAAAVNGLLKYPYEQIQEALRDLMTGEFHDILPGSSIQSVEEASLRMLDHGLEIASREKTRAFFALAAGQPKATKGRIPILVYNPHPFPVRTVIDCEFQLPDISDQLTNITVYRGGKALPSQTEQPRSNLHVDWRKRAVFTAELKPGQMNRFDCLAEVIARKPAPALKAKKGKIVFRTDQLTVVVNTRTGLIDAYRVRGRDCLGKRAFQPLVLRDIEDSWVMEGRAFGGVVGRFRLMSKAAGSAFSGLRANAPGGQIDSVRVIEDGPVRSVVEAVLAYGDSAICQRYVLPKFGTEIEIRTRVFWNEKTRMLKLSIPTLGEDSEYLGQVAYGAAQLPSNGDEAVSQKWVAVVSRKSDLALTCINDGTYGSDFSRATLRLTLLRSAAYSSEKWPCVPADRFSPRMDQGERLYRFWLNAGKVTQRLDSINREAQVKNEEPFALSFFPSGRGNLPKSVAVLSDNVVRIAAVKRAEKGADLIVRLFEPTGKARTTVLSLPFMKKKMKLRLAPFEIKTLRINLRTAKFTCTDLLERPL
ncbi:MAG: alpha-mannosidase [Phycisphaerales bacterium]|nr:MAG: alpha-mannosidase [Phycisphaerales bacterium]